MQPPPGEAMPEAGLNLPALSSLTCAWLGLHRYGPRRRGLGGCRLIRIHFGTKSGGLEDPPPNRNFSISATRTGPTLGSIGVRRFSLINMV